MGSLLEATLIHVESNQTQWRSKPVVETITLGNLLVTAFFLLEIHSSE